MLTLLISSTTHNEKQITITMPVEGWNVVLNGLNQLPYKDAAPVIQSITIQAQKQLQDTLKKK